MGVHRILRGWAMPAEFDPYHKWLGIAPEEQPPDYYRLLAINRFESDPDVIAGAADQRMLHVRSFQSGPYGAFSQQILNEVARARLCLLHDEKKAAYDEQLRHESAASETFLADINSLPVAAPLANDEPPVQAEPQPEPPVQTDSGHDLPRVGSFAAAYRPRLRRRRWQGPAALCAVMALAAGVLAWIYIAGAQREDQPATPSTPEPPTPAATPLPKETPATAPAPKETPLVEPAEPKPAEEPAEPETGLEVIGAAEDDPPPGAAETLLEAAARLEAAYSRTEAPAQLHAIASEGLALGEQALADDDLPAASRLVRVALSAARGAKDAELTKRVTLLLLNLQKARAHEPRP